MSSGTVGYTDTRSSNNYLGSVAKAIGNRLKQASNMASEERAYASKKAEDGGTSLEEAGIGKGYFQKKPLVQDLAEIGLPEPGADWVQQVLELIPLRITNRDFVAVLTIM